MEFTKNESLKAKGIGILLLLFHHLFHNVSRYESYFTRLSRFSLETLGFIGTAARVCVFVFVFLSAYGIAMLYGKKSETVTTMQFCAKRWLSLMRGFWFIFPVYFLAAAVCGMHPLAKYEGNVFLILADWFGLADLFGTPTLCGAWWYMAFAQVLVFLIPVLYPLCKKIGWAAAVFAVIALQYMPDGIQSPYGGVYQQYVFAAILGILCVQQNTFGRIPQRRGVENVFRGALLGVAILVFLRLRFVFLPENFPYQNNWNLPWLLYSGAAVFICVFSFLYLRGWIGKTLAYLGKHSGNMFFIHLLFLNGMPNVIFYTGTVLGSWLTLLAISLAASIAIEWLKKLLHYNQWIDSIIHRLEARQRSSIAAE